MKLMAAWTIPVKTVSEANCSEHWTKKSKRHKLQKRWVKATWPRAMPSIDALKTVVVKRIAPRALDCQDNLPCSMKYIVDSIAEELTGNYIPGQADSCKEITWEYKQEKGRPREYAVRIEIYEKD